MHQIPNLEQADLDIDFESISLERRLLGLGQKSATDPPGMA
jgi:hypothetical protein